VNRGVAVTAGAGVVVALMTVVFPGAWPAGLVVQGAVFGASAGLLALGLVLVYRTTRVINLSYGAMGAFAAEVGVFAYGKLHVPWGLCIVLAVAAGAGAGVGVDALLRRFDHAPRLVVTVATIGLLQVFTALQFGLPYLLHGSLVVPPFSTGLSHLRFAIGHTPFHGNDLLAVALVPFALAGLSWFLLGSETGTAVRAMAENSERAMLLGIPVRRLSRMVWILVGALAAATTILNAPTQGVPVNPFVAAGGVFLPALAAAVVAKMESLPRAFVAGVALGILDAVVTDNVHKEALSVVAFLIVILAALLLQKWNTSRADDAASLVLASGSRPLPPSVDGLPEIVWGRRALLALIGMVGVALPFLIPPSRTHTLTGYLLLGMAVLSVVVLSGWSGTVSLGQYAIVGVGAVAGGDLMAKLNLDLFVALAGAALAGALCALLIGLPALRVRPLFVAVTSLAFAAAMEEYFLNPANYPHWIPATVTRPVLWKRFPLSSERAIYFVCLGLLVGIVLVGVSLRRARTGRVLLASRDNPKTAAALSVDVTRTRVLGMVIAGVIAGISGGLYAVLEGGVGYEGFPAQTSVLLFSMAVVGGLGSIAGSLCGVALTELLIFLVGLASPQAGSLSPFATGALLLGVLIAFPGGVAQALEAARDRVARWVAARHGLAFDVAAADLSSFAGSSLAAAGSGILECRGVTASYGSLQVLFGVDLVVAPGELVALLGTNGAGKSTVLKAITGLLGSSGSVVLDGSPVAGQPTDVTARQGLAMMPGGRGTFPTLSVADNLRLACWQLRADRALAGAAQEEMLVLFPALRERLHTAAGNLSGGEQQQLSLAMAFVTKPKVLLIDELSLGLAPTIVSQLCQRVREINALGTTVVVVEQSVNVALSLAQRAVFLEKGRVRFEGPTADLLARPDILRSVFIGGGVPAATRVSGPDRGVALECHDLTKRFGGVTAVDGVDLVVPPGRIVGLIGHNGAGKTTLFDLISGFLPADGGRVVLGGVDVTGLPAHRRAVAGLGRSFQEARLFPSLTVEETVAVALDVHLRSRDPVAAAFALPASLNSEAAAFSRVLDVLRTLGLSGFAGTPVGDLSTGTRRIVELACILAADPPVVLLDEPSAGVAQRETEALGPLLRQVAAEAGCSIVVIEHDMGLLSGLCDELVALDQGTVICTGRPDEVLAHPDVIRSYLGTDEAAVRRSGRRRQAGTRSRTPRASAR
jgi:ABC-type branched-subunit amino acid transport system ATPase component/ABC-type branched-subunit amino acid transport system permease subunit